MHFLKAEFFLYVLYATALSAFFSCGNTEDSKWQEDNAYSQYKEEDISCMKNHCESHEDCKCRGADICIHSMAGMDPAIGDNVNICTIGNCNIEDEHSCPENWKCHEIPMGESLMKDASTICIIE